MKVSTKPRDGSKFTVPFSFIEKKVCWESFQALPHMRKNRPVCLHLSAWFFSLSNRLKKSFLKRKCCSFPLRLKVRKLHNQHISPRRKVKIFSICRQQFSDLPASVISISVANPSQCRARNTQWFQQSVQSRDNSVLNRTDPETWINFNWSRHDKVMQRISHDPPRTLTSPNRHCKKT